MSAPKWSIVAFLTITAIFGSGAGLTFVAIRKERYLATLETSPKQSEKGPGKTDRRTDPRICSISDESRHRVIIDLDTCQSPEGCRGGPLADDDISLDGTTMMPVPIHANKPAKSYDYCEREYPGGGDSGWRRQASSPADLNPLVGVVEACRLLITNLVLIEAGGVKVK
ncbi:hypothetical protein PG990_004451 [Apiospora arundinis]